MKIKKRFFIDVIFILIITSYMHISGSSFALPLCLFILLTFAYLIEKEITDTAQNIANRIASYLECLLLVTTYFVSSTQPDAVIGGATFLVIIFKYLSHASFWNILGAGAFSVIVFTILIVNSSIHFTADMTDKINKANETSAKNGGEIYQKGIGNPPAPSTILETETLRSVVTPPFKITEEDPYLDIIIFTVAFSILIATIELLFHMFVYCRQKRIEQSI
ncbi:hypothetical protein [Neptuniibacter sp. QD37_11]|uniref:hypothetical protein n=1 Tax=Neptuniibacter sp. QD37_11 TaxID=3398209 RepID=UPI0039F5ED00